MRINRAVNPSPIKNKIVGVASHPASSTSPFDVTISAVNMAKAFTSFTVRSAAAVPSVTVVLLNATTLRFQVGYAASQLLTIEYTVIEYV